MLLVLMPQVYNITVFGVSVICLILGKLRFKKSGAWDRNSQEVINMFSVSCVVCFAIFFIF